MIELTNFKATDTVGQLRGQINTMQNEIMSDQPFIGVAVNPSINFFDNGSLVSAITASKITNGQIYALCFPESNGIFVAKFYGTIKFTPDENAQTNSFTINVPSIKIPTRDSTIGTFVAPAHFGFLESDQSPMPVNVSVFNFALMFNTQIVQHGTTCNINGYSDRGAIVGPSVALTANSDNYLTLL